MLNAIKSLEQFERWIHEQNQNLMYHNKNLPDNNKLSLYYRGINDAQYDNIPSVYRSESLIKHEDILFKSCIHRCPDEFLNEKTAIDKLVKMQHYGLPTRLLDITTNPLIALFFALEPSELKQPWKEMKNKVNSLSHDELKKYLCKYFTLDSASQGLVYAIYISQTAMKYTDSDTITAISNIAKRPYNFNTMEKSRGIEYLKRMQDNPKDRNNPDILNESITEFNESDSILYLHHEIKDEKPYYQHIIQKRHIENIWGVEAKLNNNRIARQDGAFLLYGVLGKKEVSLRIAPRSVAEKCFKLKDIFDFIYSHEFTIDNGKISKDLIQEIEYLLEYIGFDKDYIIEQLELFSKNTIKEEANLMSNYGKIPKTSKTPARLITITDFVDAHSQSLNGLRDKLYWRCQEQKIYLLNSIYNEIKPIDGDIKKKHAKRFSNYNLFSGILFSENIIWEDSIKINKDLKFQADLNNLGYTHDKLFPELYSVAKSLKDKYGR